MIVPASCCVWALNALQNSMMLTPCWPSAGPTGGAGFAAPAGICSLIIVRTFFAMRRARIQRSDLLAEGADEAIGDLAWVGEVRFRDAAYAPARGSKGVVPL